MVLTLNKSQTVPGIINVILCIATTLQKKRKHFYTYSKMAAYCRISQSWLFRTKHLINMIPFITCCVWLEEQRLVAFSRLQLCDYMVHNQAAEIFCKVCRSIYACKPKATVRRNEKLKLYFALIK